MFCRACRAERSTEQRFCRTCGGPLLPANGAAAAEAYRINEAIASRLELWRVRGEIDAGTRARLDTELRVEQERLVELLREGTGPLQPDALAPRPVPIPPPLTEPAEAPRHFSAPPGATESAGTAEPRASEQPSAEPGASEPRAAAPEAEEPMPASEAGPFAFTEPPADEAAAKVEAEVQRESSWGRFWKPFLTDNAVWLLGAFCTVTGSLYLASLAWSHLGGAGQPALLEGMLLLYAWAFVAAGGALARREGLLDAGRVLGTIGASVAAVAALAASGLHASGPLAEGLGVAIAAAATGLLLEKTGAHFAPQHARATALLGAVEVLLLGLAPRLPALAPWNLLVPLLPLVWLVRLAPRPGLEVGAAALFHLGAPAALAAAVAFRGRPSYLSDQGAWAGACAIAGAWLLTAIESRRIRPAKFGAGHVLGLVVAAVSLGLATARPSWLGASALLATATFFEVTRVRPARWSWALVALGTTFTWLTAPTLLPGAIEPLLAAARELLGLAPGDPLPQAFLAVTTLPVGAGLLIAAMAAERRGSTAARDGLLDGVLLVLGASAAISHAGNEVRPGPLAAAAWLGCTLPALRFLTTPRAVESWAIASGWAGWELAHALLPGPLAAPVGLIGAGLASLALMRLRPAGETRMATLAALQALLASTWLPTLPHDGLSLTVWIAAALLLFLSSPATTSRVPALLGAAVLALTLAIAWPTTEGWPSTLSAALALGLLTLPLIGHRHRLIPARNALRWPPHGGLELPAVLLLIAAATIATVHLPNTGPGLALFVRLLPFGTALLWVALARRLRVPLLLLLAAFNAVVAAWGSAPLLALLELAWVALAVGLTRRWLPMRWLLPRPRLFGGDIAALNALATGLFLASVGGPIAVAGLAGLVLLAAWRPLGGTWVAVASIAATLVAAGLESGRLDGTTLALGLTLTALLGVALRHRPHPARLIGLGRSEVARGISWSAAASTLAFAIATANANWMGQPWMGAGLEALALLLAVRATGQARWLTAACIALAVALDTLGLEKAQVALLDSGIALALGLVAAAGWHQPRLLRRLLRVKVASRFAWALALGALSLGFVGLAHDFKALPLLFAAGALFASAHATGFAPFVFAGFAALAAATGLTFPDRTAPLQAFGFASAGIGLAIATRRWPTSLSAAFLGRTTLATPLRRTLLLGGVLSTWGLLPATVVTAVGTLSRDVPFALAAMSLLTAASLLASPHRRWGWLSGALLLAAGATVRGDDRLLFVTLAAHLLLVVAGEWWPRRASAALRTLLDGCAPAPSRWRPAKFDALRRAFTLAPRWGGLLMGLGLGAVAMGRLLDHKALSSEELAVAPALATWSLHLLLLGRGRTEPLWGLAWLPVIAALLSPPLHGHALLGLLLACFAAAASLWSGRRERALRPFTHPRALAWSAGLLVLATLATGGRVDRFSTAATFAFASIGWLFAARRQAGWAVLGWLGLVAASHALLAAIGVALGGGRPHEAILPAFALASMALALSLDLLRRRGELPGQGLAALLTFGLGLLEATAGVLALTDMRPMELALAVAAAGLAVGFALRRAVAGSVLWGWLAQLLFVGTWLALRFRWPGGPLDGQADALAAIAFGLIAVALHRWASNRGFHGIAGPAHVVAHLGPLLGLVGTHDLGATTLALHGLALSLHFATVIGMGGGTRAMKAMVALALDLATVAFCISRGIDDPQLFGLPLGLTLVGAARLFQEELSPRARWGLRTAGLLGVHLSGAASAFLFDDPWRAVLAAAICLAVALGGIGLRSRVHVQLGSAFFVLTVLGHLARAGFHTPWLGALLLTSTGLALVGGWVVFLRERASVLERLAKLQRLMEGWE